MEIVHWVISLRIIHCVHGNLLLLQMKQILKFMWNSQISIMEQLIPLQVCSFKLLIMMLKRMILLMMFI